MAAVTRASVCRPVSPPAYEVNDKGQASVALTAGDLLIVTATTPGNGFEKVWAKADVANTDPHGIALMNAKAGAIVSVGIQGEMEYGSGMTPGAPLYPSASVAGGLDTSKPTGAVERIRAVTPTRIRYNFV